MITKLTGSLYERYLAREVLGATLLVLAAFLGLFGFFDMINELKEVGQQGYQLKDAVLFVLLRQPGRVYELVPICVLIGTLYALAALARHSEVNVLRVSGVSTQQMLGALFRAAGVMALVTLLVGEFVTPVTERLAQQVRLKATNSVVGGDFRSGLWVKDGLTFINIRGVLPDARLQGVRLYEFGPDLRLLRVSDAAEGEYLPPDAWRLSQVTSSVLDADGRTARVETQAEVRWRSALNPDILSVLSIVPERMSLNHLLSYIRHLSDNKQDTDRYEIAVWKKIIYPLASLVMVALALPFGYAHNRVSGVSLKIFAGVMIGILFHMLNGLFSSLGAINNWPPLASAVTPSLLFLCAAASMLWWVERR